MIKATALTKKFDDFTALDNISCSIPNGCIYGLVGSNGAGKSTFLRLISGVYRPDGGSVTIDDKEVFENPEAKKHIAFVPDELYFLPGSSMSRMASLHAAVYPDFDMERFSFLADAFKLDTKKSLNTFSKGMRRQAATILAISSKPDYLLMDETFDGLDPVMRNLVKSLICEDVVERKATAILSSHSLRELEDTCDQLALLHKGGLVFESDIVNLKTSLFKIQTAFNYDYDKNLFAGIDMLHFSKHGSVSNIIVRGNRDVTISRMKSLNPILLDVLPLTLEEVFTYEMEALGYTFQDVLEVK
ncbi:MAG: ABC transporter ATP-binding protein [Lachnospiraceae bacterium]|nr:ABC transporter ATP-binding protein [Lachnospiraceae bacterium]